MKTLFVLALAAVCFAQEMPGNVRITICSTYVKKDETVYTNPVSFAKRAWRVGQIAIRDTSIAKQDTIDMGDGVAVWQQIGILRGFHQTAAQRLQIDTAWIMVGDTADTPFANAEGLSADSVIVSKIDTTQTIFAKMGLPGDSLQLTKGYFSLLPDPAPLTRFKVKGAADAEGVLAVYIIINDFEGVPIWNR
jgi:hypothetical protein